MVFAIACAGILLLLVAALTWTARLLRISNLDATLERVHAVLLAEDNQAR